MMNSYRIIPSIILLCLLAVPIPQAFAQKAAAQDTDVVKLEEVVVTGSRVIGRSAVDSPVPIDVLEGKNFTNYGIRDMNSLLSGPACRPTTSPSNPSVTLERWYARRTCAACLRTRS